jgi:hypothetical protein
MGKLSMVIGEALQVTVFYDYDKSEDIVSLNEVYINYTDVIDMLSNDILEEIVQKIFDTYNKELQEPERE